MNESTSTPAASASAAQSGHQPGDHRTSATTATSTSPAKTAPISVPFRTSATQPPSRWVESPQRRSRTNPRQKPSGSRTNAETQTTIAAKAGAAADHGRSSTAP